MIRLFHREALSRIDAALSGLSALMQTDERERLRRLYARFLAIRAEIEDIDLDRPDIDRIREIEAELRDLSGALGEMADEVAMPAS